MVSVTSRHAKTAQSLHADGALAVEAEERPDAIRIIVVVKGITRETIPDIRVRLLWVMPLIASSVITAPLWGIVSNPPDAIEATRCSSSGFSPTCIAQSKVLGTHSFKGDAHAARGGASDTGKHVAARASEISGVPGSMLRRKSRTEAKPGRELMMFP